MVARVGVRMRCVRETKRLIPALNSLWACGNEAMREVRRGLWASARKRPVGDPTLKSSLRSWLLRWWRRLLLLEIVVVVGGSGVGGGDFGGVLWCTYMIVVILP